MTSNEQQNYEQAGGSGFNYNPFGFRGSKYADSRSLDEILKDFEEFLKFDD